MSAYPSHQRAQVLERKSPFYTPSVVEALYEIEARLGGRHALVGMLALAPLSPDLRYVLGMLGDPAHDRLSLAEICARGNLLPGSLLEHLASAAMLAGKIQAAQRIGEGMAAVAADVMRRAVPYEDRCYRCNGVGTLPPHPTASDPNPGPEPCEICNTVGRLVYQPDLDRQKLAIEMAQLLPKSAGIQIANIQTGGKPASGGEGAFEKLQQATDKILYGVMRDAPEADPPVDAELVDSVAADPPA